MHFPAAKTHDGGGDETGSHAIYVSKPEVVAALIAKAAQDVSAKATVN